MYNCACTCECVYPVFTFHLLRQKHTHTHTHTFSFSLFFSLGSIHLFFLLCSFKISIFAFTSSSSTENLKEKTKHWKRANEKKKKLKDKINFWKYFLCLAKTMKILTNTLDLNYAVFREFFFSFFRF